MRRTKIVSIEEIIGTALIASGCWLFSPAVSLIVVGAIMLAMAIREGAK